MNKKTKISNKPITVMILGCRQTKNTTKYYSVSAIGRHVFKVFGENTEIRSDDRRSTITRLCLEMSLFINNVSFKSNTKNTDPNVVQIKQKAERLRNKYRRQESAIISSFDIRIKYRTDISFKLFWLIPIKFTRTKSLGVFRVFTKSQSGELTNIVSLKTLKKHQPTRRSKKIGKRVA